MISNAILKTVKLLDQFGNLAGYTDVEFLPATVIAPAQLPQVIALRESNDCYDSCVPRVFVFFESHSDFAVYAEQTFSWSLKLRNKA